jgi:phosphatidate cytidylyltransferase
MTNVAQRLLLFFIGIPIFIALVVFLPGYHHAAVAVLAILLAGGSAAEMARLLRAGGIEVSIGLSTAFGFLVPSLYFAETFLSISSAGRAGLATIGLGILAVACFAPFAYAKKENLEKVLKTASGYGFLLIYPCLLSGFIVLIASEAPHATEAIFSYAFLTLGNDSLAWLTGVTLGKRKNLVAASPNKSLAGFIGGMGGSCAGILLARFLFPSAFASSSVWALLVMALAVGIAAISGDLFESALKRSVGVKDSGHMVPGRGGFLDSFDSLLFAAPVFYVASLLLGLFR